MNALRLCRWQFSRKETLQQTFFKWGAILDGNRPIAVFEPPLGGLRATYDDHLKLIGKRVVDFLLVLIELFSLWSYGWGATSDYWLKIGDFAPTGAVDTLVNLLLKPRQTHLVEYAEWTRNIRLPRISKNPCENKKQRWEKTSLEFVADKWLSVWRHCGGNSVNTWHQRQSTEKPYVIVLQQRGFE